MITENHAFEDRFIRSPLLGARSVSGPQDRKSYLTISELNPDNKVTN